MPSFLPMSPFIRSLLRHLDGTVSLGSAASSPIARQLPWKGSAPAGPQPDDLVSPLRVVRGAAAFWLRAGAGESLRHPTDHTPLELDLDVHSCRQIEPHQDIDRLRIRLEHVYQPLVRADLEVLVGVLVDEGRTAHRESFDARRQRNRSDDLGPGALGRLDDTLRRLVEHAVVVGLESDADLLLRHACATPGSR